MHILSDTCPYRLVCSLLFSSTSKPPSSVNKSTSLDASDERLSPPMIKAKDSFTSTTADATTAVA